MAPLRCVPGYFIAVLNTDQHTQLLFTQREFQNDRFQLVNTKIRPGGFRSVAPLSAPRWQLCLTHTTPLCCHLLGSMLHAALWKDTLWCLAHGVVFPGGLLLFHHIWGMNEIQIYFSIKHTPFLQPQSVSSQVDAKIFLSFDHPGSRKRWAIP